MSFAQMALGREVVDAPVSNDRIANLEATRVIFFAGDAIPPHEKYEMSDIKGFGGIYMPHVRTLPQGSDHGSRGMVYKCSFTPLRAKMKPEWNMMLSPEARKNWEKEFVQTVSENGQVKQRTVKGFTGSNQQAVKAGTFKQEHSDHLVFTKRYPGEDIRMATTRSIPNGVGGVVEITALVGASNEEIAEAQNFFFPEWDDIVAGLKTLPETIDAVEKHIRVRIAAIAGTFYGEKATKYQSIGRDMLKSCTEFKRTGTQIIEKDDSALKAAAKDDAQGHSPVSNHLLDQLKIKRKGDLLAGDHDAINRLADIMLQDKLGASPDLEAQKLELALLEAKNKAMELELALAGQKTVVTSGYIAPVNAPANPPSVITTTPNTDGITYTATVPIGGYPTIIEGKGVLILGDEPGTAQAIPVGTFTEVEEVVEEVAEEAIEIKVHDSVWVSKPHESALRSATVIAKPFKRIKVQYEDGTEETVTREQISKTVNG